jgi:hypothetical protein
MSSAGPLSILLYSLIFEKVVINFADIQSHGGMMSPHNPLHHHPHHSMVHSMPMSDADTDPRELEAFAER